MEPIVFQTKSGNLYLYSPLTKTLLPLPPNVYDIISIKCKDIVNSAYQKLKEYGYLDEFSTTHDGCITGNSVSNALANLSQIIFETTTRCNLRCDYCCYSEGYDTFDSRRGISGNLNFDTAKSIIDYLAFLFQKEPLSNAPKEPFAISIMVVNH